VNTADVNLVVGNAVENRLHHHLEHDTPQMRSDASVRPEPEGDVAVGCPVQNHFVGSLELVLVVVGGEPADDQPVVAPKLLAPRKSRVTVRLSC
jgi:hypothetical protein